MGITSLQVCMDSSDWLHQGTISEENNNVITGMESSAISPTMSDEEDNNILATCTSSRLPLIHERRSSIIRPQHQQALNCPRCDSTNTKFCYYNNYSLSQPRYFCKTCRRYWTKGGTLRNIPVGGGCRKTKKPTSKKSSNDHHHPNNNNNYNDNHRHHSPPPPPSSILNHPQNLYCSTTATTGMLSPLLTNFSNNDSTELQLAFPDQIQYFSSGIFNTINPNLNHHGNFFLENPITPIDFLDNKYETLVGSSSSSHDFMGNNHINGDNINLGGGLLLHHNNNFHGINCSSSTAGTILESCQRLMQLPYHDEINNQELLMDVKPNPSKILPLEWHDSQQQQQQQACNSDAGISYLGGIGSWTGLINGYGTSNPLV